MLSSSKVTQLVDELARKLCAAIPGGLRTAREEMEKNFRSILQASFSKLDLVSREEFDTQTAVLSKTRSKLDVLESVVKDLEAQLLNKTTDKSSQDYEG